MNLRAPLSWEKNNEPWTTKTKPQGKHLEDLIWKNETLLEGVPTEIAQRLLINNINIKNNTYI